jgi:hypothetical protein
LSVIVEIVCFDTSVPYTSARCAAISPWVSPLADNDSTSSSTPDSLRWRLRTICGSNVPATSRGTLTSTGPTSVSTVLVLVPLRLLPLPLPAGSCLPYPTWSVISPSSADSRTRLVSCCSRPPSPVSFSPSPRARSTNIAINCSSVTAPADPTAGSCSTVVSVVIWRLSLDQQIRRYLYSPY